jgi:hypothetical protein
MDEHDDDLESEVEEDATGEAESFPDTAEELEDDLTDEDLALEDDDGSEI